MPISVRVDEQNSEATLVVEKRFTFEQHEMFTKFYKSLNPGLGHYVVDLRPATIMDSSGLAMLLKLRDHVGDEPGRIRVLTRPGQITDTLRTAFFDQIFELVVE
jgi:anti-anti-sigma factor